MLGEVAFTGTEVWSCCTIDLCNPLPGGRTRAHLLVLLSICIVWQAIACPKAWPLWASGYQPPPSSLSVPHCVPELLLICDVCSTLACCDGSSANMQLTGAVCHVLCRPVSGATLSYTDSRLCLKHALARGRPLRQHNQQFNHGPMTAQHTSGNPARPGALEPPYCRVCRAWRRAMLW